MTNVMLDFETWGTRPGAALRSIGAVMFDPYTSQLGSEFYSNIDEASCLEVGLHKDPGTIKWWSDPKLKKANEQLLINPRPLREVIDAFNQWWRSNRAVFVWGQGSNFDPVLWDAATHAVGLSPPWKFWDCFDTRTAYMMARFNSRAVKRNGTYHNALDDAKHQAKCVQMSFSRVQVGGG